jgi:serine/threonine protein phosphatase PrpC
VASLSARVGARAGAAGPAGVVPRAAARTHPGRVRPTNEDVAVLDAARGIFGVIDGIGGHAAGEVAAATAKDVILQRLARPLGTPAERVREAIAIANNTIFRRASDSPDLAGMACVITLALVADGRLTIGHVGDTRLYKLRPGTEVGVGIRKLTRDHSPVGEREDAGELSEADAMRHPHRNEVFRDVGTIFRDKDEEEFVDVIDEPLETDSAILICSDGLSDMLPGATIAHIVRQHAGDPEQVVEALVTAANDAGGRDNVTVVYAEMPRFADAATRGVDQGLTPTEPPTALGAGVGATAVVSAPRRPAASGTAQNVSQGSVRRVTRAIVNSRMTWFALGALGGVFGAMALTEYVARVQGRGSQTLIVAPGGGGVSPYTTISAALAAARPGDVVRVDPGTYRERVDLRDGVDLIARVPGTVSIAAEAGGSAAAPLLSISGALNVRVAGIKIESGADAPVDTAVSISAPAATLDMIEIAGARQAFALSPSSSITVRGSHISVADSLLAIPDDGHATFANSVLTRLGGTAGAPAGVSSSGNAARGTESVPGANAGPATPSSAISLSPSAHVVLRGNVFAGFGNRILDGVPPAQRAELLAGNIVIPVDEHTGAGATGSSSGPTTAAANPATPRTRRRVAAPRQVPESGR